jgi:hypothetical protein
MLSPQAMFRCVAFVEMESRKDATTSTSFLVIVKREREDVKEEIGSEPYKKLDGSSESIMSRVVVHG